MKDDSYKFTERDTKKWNSQKRRSKHKRPDLNPKQIVVFLELLSKMSGSTVFERKLGLSANDVEHYKKTLDIESQEEARIELRKIKKLQFDQAEVRILEQTEKAKEAAEIANKRLQEINENKLNKEKTEKTRRSVNEVREDDAERQRRFKQSENKTIKSADEWRLPIDSSESVDRFKREIINRGFVFLKKKYGATQIQVKAEAQRLGLSINWDIVKR